MGLTVKAYDFPMNVRLYQLEVVWSEYNGTLRSSNMAMENTLFIGDFPIETPISSGFPIAAFERVRGLWPTTSHNPVGMDWMSTVPTKA